MFYSAETRWFFEGTLPESVTAWFDSSLTARREPNRTDEYLLLPGCTTTGVKLREERLEVKAQIHPPERVAYDHTVSGTRDAWVKWSRPIGEGGALRNIRTAENDRWAFVQKTRSLRVLSLDSGPPLEIIDPATRLANGCQLELSTVRAAVGRLDSPPSPNDWDSAGEWWSLSLEAFAPWHCDGIHRFFENLEAGARYLFNNAPPVRLTNKASCSYPAWLQQFTGD